MAYSRENLITAAKNSLWEDNKDKISNGIDKFLKLSSICSKINGIEAEAVIRSWYKGMPSIWARVKVSTEIKDALSSERKSLKERGLWLQPSDGEILQKLMVNLKELSPLKLDTNIYGISWEYKDGYVFIPIDKIKAI